MSNIEKLKTMKTVFVYDEDGFYCGTHIAQLNPRNKSSWLMPPHSTNVDPNDEDGFFFKIKDPGNPESGWDKIPYPSTAEDFLALNIPHESRTKRNNDLRRLLSQFAQNDPEHYREVSVNDESGKKIATKLEVIPEPTPEELKERAAAAVRSKRDYLLSKTDYLVSGDYPISAEDLVKVKAYRQSLRDIPSRGSKLRIGYAQNRSIECPSYLLNWIAQRSMSFLSLTARSAHRLRAAEESSSADLNLLQFPSSDCSFRCIWASRSRTRRAVSLRVVIVVCSFASSRSFSCRRESWLCSINSRSWVHCSSIFCWPT